MSDSKCCNVEIIKKHAFASLTEIIGDPNLEYVIGLIKNYMTQYFQIIVYLYFIS